VLTRAIECYASIAPKQVLTEFFKDIIQRLLTATMDSKQQVMRPVLTELALMLVANLDDEALMLLFRVIKPQLTDANSAVMKKSYKVLLRLCEHHADFVQANLEALQEMLTSTAASCNTSSKRARILCLREIAMTLDDASLVSYVPMVLAEVILATREANQRAREAAFEFFVSVGHRTASCATLNLTQFVTAIIAGLGGQTAHMISATVLALARLVFEFKGELVHTLPSLFGAITTLLEDRTHEIARAVLGFVKAAVTWLPTELLEPYLPALLAALLTWSADSRNEFRLKVRVIIERLMRKVGADTLKQFFPEEHAKFLVHIRKKIEREKRHTVRRREEAKNRTDEFYETVEGDEEEEEDAEDVDVSGEGGSEMAEDHEEGDMLGGGRLQDAMAQASQHMRRKGKRGRDDDAEDENDVQITVNEEGKFVIEDTDDVKKPVPAVADAEPKTAAAQRGAKRVRHGPDKFTEKFKQSGSAFKAKNAGGDVKKGKLDPFAYIPLDNRLVNKKKRGHASKGLKAVLSGSKAATKLAKKRGAGGHKKR